MVSLILLSILASVMVISIIATIYFIERKIKTLVHVFFTYFILIMMLFMLVGAFIYLYSPSETTMGVAVAINMISMIVILAYFFSQAENLSKETKMTQSVLAPLAVLLVVNEVMMGAVFSLSQLGVSNFSTLYSALNNSLNSVWFFYPMMAEMVATVLIIFTSIPEVDLKDVIPLIGITTFPPTVFRIPIWVYTSVVFDTAFAILGIVKGKREWKILYFTILISTLAVIFNNYLVFAFAIAGSMVYFYDFIFCNYKNKLTN